MIAICNSTYSHSIKEDAMEAIYDAKGRIICYGNYQTGEIRNKYRDQIICFTLAIGCAMMIQRLGNTITMVKRMDDGRFYVYHQSS